MIMKFKTNENFNQLKQNYLFSDIAKKVRAYSNEHPDAKIIRLGIGDVTLPLAGCVVEAMKKAADEMGRKETFRGYAPEAGYDFLREAIVRHYADFGVTLSPSEVFVSDGAKSDVGNIVDILGDNPILIPDPVYPVYMDSNIMAGRRITLLEGNMENGFLPTPDGLSGEGYVIYICSPNNPTGAVYDREGLSAWVDFANRTGSLILFDSAYEAFIEGDYPHSIFAIEGARACAIEICSLSKTAGFTGTRCAWTIVPAELTGEGGVSLNALWERRQSTKFNGVPYVIQRAAEAALSDEGKKQCRLAIDYYKENARRIADLMNRKSIRFTGGINSPYIWLQCPDNMDSWRFFDFLLTRAHVVGTPGAGFGHAGEGFFRLTSFGSHDATAEAIERLEEILS